MSAALRRHAAPRGATAGTPESAEKLAAAGGALVTALTEHARHIAALAAAEVRLAALSGVAILALGLLAAAALLATWALLGVLAVDGLRRLGLSWQLAVALLAVLHLLAAYGLWRGAVGLSANLGLPRLRRTLFAQGAPVADAGRQR